MRKKENGGKIEKRKGEGKIRKKRKMSQKRQI